MQWWQFREALNLTNGSTLVGLGIARIGGAQLGRGSRGLVLATRFRIPFPKASAFTVGNVVLTRYDESWLTARPMLLRHEERHATQYAACCGLPMIAFYLLATGWSYLRGGDGSTYNVFERHAGLAAGGYPVTRQ